MPRKVEISYKTIVFTVFFLLSLGLVYLLKELLLELFVALLLMVILDPLVVILSKYKVPRGISVLLTYVFVIALLVGVVSSIVPAVVEQTTGFFNTFPNYLSKIGATSFISSDILTGFVNNNVSSAPNAIFELTFSVVNNVVGILTVLVFAFYMLMSREKLNGQLGSFFGEAKQKELGELIDTLEKKMGGWARGELILMLTVGATTYIGLSLLGIPYALPLAIFAGLFELIPFLGPIISAIPSVLIGFGISPVMGIGAAALAFLIQQMENYVLVPKVMEKSAGVSPLMTLIALAIGARLAGVVGAIISVPVLITLQVLANKYFSSNSK
jgi:predicted PurR-regulated permease PerM